MIATSSTNRFILMKININFLRNEKQCETKLRPLFYKEFSKCIFEQEQMFVNWVKVLIIYILLELIMKKIYSHIHILCNFVK